MPISGARAAAARAEVRSRQTNRPLGGFCVCGRTWRVAAAVLLQCRHRRKDGELPCTADARCVPFPGAPSTSEKAQFLRDHRLSQPASEGGAVGSGLVDPSEPFDQRPWLLGGCARAAGTHSLSRRYSNRRERSSPLPRLSPRCIFPLNSLGPQAAFLPPLHKPPANSLSILAALHPCLVFQPPPAPCQRWDVRDGVLCSTARH